MHYKTRLQPVTWILLISLGLLLVGCEESTAPASSAKPEKLFERFQGSYFSLEYSTEFQPQPSLKAEAEEGYDSVFFHQVNGPVSFYVCAPAWPRDCEDFAFDSEKEVVLVKDPPVNTGLYELTRINVEARDKSYQRLIEERLLVEEEQKIISGARYDKLTSFEEVRPFYIILMKSLRYPDPLESE